MRPRRHARGHEAAHLSTALKDALKRPGAKELWRALRGQTWLRALLDPPNQAMRRLGTTLAIHELVELLGLSPDAAYAPEDGEPAPARKGRPPLAEGLVLARDRRKKPRAACRACGALVSVNGRDGCLRAHLRFRLGEPGSEPCPGSGLTP